MDTKPPCKVLWYGEEWVCSDQLQTFRFPRQFKECFLIGCPGRGPYVEKKVIEAASLEGPLEMRLDTLLQDSTCSFFKCESTRAPGRKYCSDRCRLRSARWNYEQRNKEVRRARKRKKC